MPILRLIVLASSIVGITAFLTFGSSGWAHPEGPHTKEQLVEHMNELLYSSHTHKTASVKKSNLPHNSAGPFTPAEQTVSKIF